MIRDLRAKLPSRSELIASEGFLPVAALFEAAGSAARGVLISVSGLPASNLSPEGRTFVREFGATQPGGRVRMPSVYAAEATVALLDALAGSDGSRPAVTRRLLATSVRRGLLGASALTPTATSARRPHDRPC